MALSNSGRLILLVVSASIVSWSLFFLTQNNMTITSIIFVLTLIAACMISFASYIERQRCRIEQIIEALKPIDLVRDGLSRPQFNLMYGRLPDDLKRGTHLANLVLPFSQPSVLSAYTFSFGLMGWLRSAIKLSDEESEIVTQWRQIPHKITWQRWHDDYYRVQLEMVDPVSQQTSTRELGSYNQYIATTLWREQLGELNTAGCTFKAEISLDVSPDFIRIYVSGGRFGISDNDEFPYVYLTRPPEGGLILEVPLTEPELMPFDVKNKPGEEHGKERRIKPPLWSAADGRPPVIYECTDIMRGHWRLCYYFDRRPLFSGRIEKIVPSPSGKKEDESILISFTSDSYIESRYSWIKPHYFGQPSYKSADLLVEENVYIVFRKDGKVDQLIREDEIFTPVGRLKAARHGNKMAIE